MRFQPGTGEETDLADLKETAEQFAKDLTAMNIAGLMLVFTPNGMTKAMAMQQQMLAGGASATPQATGYDVIVGEAAGSLTPVELVLKNDEGEVTVDTSWQEVAGAWKVEDISLRQ